jgi:hypothetical protein
MGARQVRSPADLVERRAVVIVTQTLPAALAAKAATTTTPIVFVIGEDPVEVGLQGAGGWLEARRDAWFSLGVVQS